MEAIYSKNAPAVIGPYSQAVKCGQYIFCSGQLGINPATGELVGDDIKTQTKQAMENLQAVLKEAGSDFSEVVKVHIYLKNIGDFSLVNEVYATYFKKPYPARATIEASKLPKDALVEIDCIAVIKSKKVISKT